MSRDISSKARTAACYREPSGGLLEGVDIKLALGTDGQRINLPADCQLSSTAIVSAVLALALEPESRTLK